MPSFLKGSERSDMGLCLIPAAGFGKRVGQPQAKEMLIDPENGEPLINWSIRVALNFGLKPLVITRPEKTNLIEYLKREWPEAEIFLINSSREWPHSLLLSEAQWVDVNLMLLPDTRFGPIELVSSLIEDCRTKAFDASFAYFETSESLKTWGVLDLDEFSYRKNIWTPKDAGSQIRICEKPIIEQLSAKHPYYPWGFFAFRKKIGQELFSGLLNSSFSHEWFELNGTVNLHQLSYFKDMTRSVSDLESNKS